MALMVSVAEVTMQIASSETHKNCCGASVKALALQGVKYFVDGIQREVLSIWVARIYLLIVFDVGSHVVA